MNKIETSIIRRYELITSEIMTQFKISNKEEIKNIRMGNLIAIGTKNPINIIIETEEIIND